MIYKTVVGQFTYAELLTEDVNVANTEFLRAIEIEFEGTLAAAGGTTDGALRQDGLLNTILNSILFTANGSDRFISTNGRNEYFRRAIKSGSAGVLGSVMPVGIASTAQRAHVVIDMDEIATGAKFAGRINAKRLTNLELRVITGQAEVNMVTGGDRTETLAGTFNVYAVWDDGGRKTVGAPDAFRYRGGGRRIPLQRLSVVAANNRAEMFMSSGLIIPSIMFLVVDADLRNNDLLNNVEIKVGENDVLRDVSYNEIQSQNVERYGLELVAGLPPYDGVVILDFDLDGDMNPAKLLSTVGMKANSVKAVLDVGGPTGTSYVDMVVYAIDPSGVGK